MGDTDVDCSSVAQSHRARASTLSQHSVRTVRTDQTNRQSDYLHPVPTIDNPEYQAHIAHVPTLSQHSIATVRTDRTNRQSDYLQPVPTITRNPPSSRGSHRSHNSNGTYVEEVAIEMDSKPLEATVSPAIMPAFRKRRAKPMELDDYFEGPRSIDKHSKWPMFLRMHGSIFPQLVFPVISCGIWASLITCISHFFHPLGVSNILLTVLGFVVSLAISLRSNTSYERYSEGRRYWSQLMLVSQHLAREIWVTTDEREGEEGKEDLLRKLTGLNLIVGFANALKHKLRFEPYAHYEDLQGLVQHLDTYAMEAEDPDLCLLRRRTAWKTAGTYLGVPMAESNPRKQLKRARKPLGNLPLEILSHLSRYIDTLTEAPEGETPKLRGYHMNLATNAIYQLNDVLAGTERILNTPLPIAYTIAISQITWLYVLMLPFQLWSDLGWITIPGTMAAAYIILGFEAIGREIENPFGHDVNDLPLDDYCNQLASEIDLIASMPPPDAESFMKRSDNMVLFPFSSNGYEAWASRSADMIRERLKSRPYQTMEETKEARKSVHESQKTGPGEV